MKFEELPLCEELQDALYDMYFDQCTPIQEKCIPEILAGKDLMGIAQTGTGKTAAYLLPILSRLQSDPVNEDKVDCVIMAPTRELAQQIDQAMQGFGYYLDGITGLAVYGGNDGERYQQEIRSLKMGTNVIIATPGRLLSHLALGNVDLSHVSYFVLDEADRMLDMGFYDDIMSIYKKIKKDCQVIMFSATMPDKIDMLAKKILKNPTEIKLAVTKPAQNIDQSAYVCYENQKTGIIKHIFKNKQISRTIIFCGQKTRVKEIARILQKNGLNTAEMHSDLQQSQRDQVMLDFRSRRTEILVATDIVARGIDIDDVTMVINYDVPTDVEDYIHRIGRTARADKQGEAITLIGQEQINDFYAIEKVLETSIHKNPVPESLGEAPQYQAQEKSAKKKKNNHKKYQHNKPAHTDAKGKSPKRNGTKAKHDGQQSTYHKRQNTSQKPMSKHHNRQRGQVKNDN